MTFGQMYVSQVTDIWFIKCLLLKCFVATAIAMSFEICQPMSLGQMSLGKMTVGQMSVSQIIGPYLSNYCSIFGQISVSQMTIGRMYVSQVTDFWSVKCLSAK
jgi:hypothetical protein